MLYRFFLGFISTAEPETLNTVARGAAPLILFGNLVLSFPGNCNCASSKPHLKGFSSEYLQLWGRFFNGITLPEVRPMDVGSDWFGAIKQPLEGSSDHSP